MTTTISSRGQTVIPAEIRARHHLTEQSRLAWIDDGQTIRVVPLAAGANKYGRGIAKDLDLARALRAEIGKGPFRGRRRIASPGETRSGPLQLGVETGHAWCWCASRRADLALRM